MTTIPKTGGMWRRVSRTVTSSVAAAMMAAVVVCGISLPANAGLFDPAAKVNDRVVTQYEVEQRMLFLKLTGVPGNLAQEALDRLIDERLYQEAGARMGIEISQAELLTGMQEFASRANLEVEPFLKALAKEGIDAHTFRDFVRNGLIWRQVVRGRFAARLQISEAEIDRALSLSSRRGGVRVLLSEIILPADTPERLAQSKPLADQLSQITGFAAFADAARRYSAVPSRERGGRIDWMPLTNLPPNLRGLVFSLSPGEVSDPVELPNAILLFQMRAIAETDVEAPKNVAVEYGVLRLAGGLAPETLALAQAIDERVDVCDDLYGENQGHPEERLEFISLAQEDIPGDIAVELAKMDAHETSAVLTRNQGSELLFIMLCGRTELLEEEASRDEIRAGLANTRIENYANGYLEELRSEAIIELAQ